MADVVKMPTNAEVSAMEPKVLIQTFNAFASTAGRNPVNRFATRAVGVKRLTELLDELRANGKTTPAGETKWPLVVAKPAPEPEKPAPKAEKAPKPAKPAPVPAKLDGQPETRVKDGKLSLAGRLRELIASGLDNDGVWKIVQPEYSLEDYKRAYVASERRWMAKRAAAAAK